MLGYGKRAAYINNKKKRFIKINYIHIYIHNRIIYYILLSNFEISEVKEFVQKQKMAMIVNWLKKERERENKSCNRYKLYIIFILIYHKYNSINL